MYLEEKKRRLIQALNNSHLKGKDLANKVGITPGNITRYKQGVMFPKSHILIKLCDVLNVSPNYILCETDDPTPTKGEKGLLPSNSINEKLENVNTNGKQLIQQLYNNFINSVDYISNLEEFKIVKSNKNIISKNLTFSKLTKDFSNDKADSCVGGCGGSGAVEEEKEKFTIRRGMLTHNFYEKMWNEEHGVKGVEEIVHIDARAAAGFDEVFEVDEDYSGIAYNVPRDYDLAILIEGNSMEPIFHNNEIVFARKIDHVDNGLLGIFKLEEKILFKKYITNYKDVFLLRSLNSEYEDIDLTEYDPFSFRVIAKIIL